MASAEGVANGSGPVASAEGNANGSGPVASAEGIVNGSGPVASAEGANGSGPVASAEGVRQGLISHEHSAVTSVEPLANLGETHSQAESSGAREETRITVESLVNLGEACS